MRRRTTEEREASRFNAEVKIKELLRKNGWMTIREICDSFPSWHVRNCAAWVTHLRRQGRPWLVAEQRPNGKLHPFTKKPMVVWSYRLADTEYDSPFMAGLGGVPE